MQYKKRKYYLNIFNVKLYSLSSSIISAILKRCNFNSDPLLFIRYLRLNKFSNGVIITSSKSLIVFWFSSNLVLFFLDMPNLLLQSLILVVLTPHNSHNSLLLNSSSYLSRIFYLFILR